MTCEIVVERASDTLPQTGSEALFAVSGGRVLVSVLVGEVTTAIQNQLNQTKIVFNPAVGSNRDLCAQASIEDAGVGTIFTVNPPVPNDPLSRAESCGPAGFSSLYLLGIGDIELSCSASNTGQVKWLMVYTPLDLGALVTAA